MRIFTRDLQAEAGGKMETSGSSLPLSPSGFTIDSRGKYWKRAEEVLELSKPLLDAIVSSEFVLHEAHNKTFEELAGLVEELKNIFNSWQPFSSKIYFALQIEWLISNIWSYVMDIFQQMESSEKPLPDASIQHCLQKIKLMQFEKISSIIDDALRDEQDGSGPSSELLLKIGENIGLSSNQEILIEAVALEKLKENTKQAEKNTKVMVLDRLIGVVERMHDRLVQIKQIQTFSSVLIPSDFFCPLSLEVMTDPVIVASGQTYERASIKKWIDLGLMVCPKTRQNLTHIILTPNYMVKALIANWCMSNSVKLPDPLRPMSLNQLTLSHADSEATMSSESFHPLGNYQPMTLMNHTSGLCNKGSLSANGTMTQEMGDPPSYFLKSETLVSDAVGNRHGMVIGRLLPNNCYELSSISEENKQVAFDQLSVSSNNGSTHSTEIQELYENNSKSFLPLADADGNSEGSAHVNPENSETPGKMMPAAPANTTLAATQSEPSPKLVNGSLNCRTIMHGQSEGNAPRLVSTAMEVRADLLEFETQVKILVENLKSPSVDAQREATAELRLLAKHSMDNREVIANSGAIDILINLLHSTDPKTQENAVTALLNLSINENIKSILANANAIEPLIHVLETGCFEAKKNSAATLFSLSLIEENKIRIGQCGAIKPLVDLLGKGTPQGKKDAAMALLNLSFHLENRIRIAQAGAVRHLVQLMDPAFGIVDKVVAILANLATITEGRNMIGQEGGIPVLIEVLELGSAREKENAAATLLQLCTNSQRFCKEMLQEGVVPPLLSLSCSGTPRAKEKARGLLSYFRNQWHGHAGQG